MDLERDISLELLAGMPIKIQDSLYVYQYIIKQIIVNIGIEKYNLYLSLLLIDEDYIEETLNKDDLNITPYEFTLVNCLHNIDFRNLLLEAYKVFLKYEVVFDKQYGLICIANDNPISIDLELYQKIQQILRKSNYIPEPEKYDPANEKAKEFIKKLKKNRRNAKKYIKSEFTLADVISGVKWRSGESYRNIFNLTMYQLYDGLSRLQVIDNYDNTMFGIYTGNIDSKKIDSKLSWFKAIDKNK